MAYENLLVERDGGVLTITINRPKVLNALNGATLAELASAIDDAGTDAGVRVVVITGSGDRAFVAGADINELAALTPVGGQEHGRRGQLLFERIDRLGKPVIAAINGFALGGGCELAMACTVRLAADTAKLGQPEINLGLIPGFAGTQRLARLVGRGRALEMLLTGQPISADEAWRIGLVNRVVPAAELATEVRTLAVALASKPAVAVRFILEAVTNGLDMAERDAEQYEATLFGLVFSTDDMREGTRAFLEKRKPEFTGK
jgi:enoyl-CoA hydratase